MDLLTSPSFHHISPLVRSRSDVRSSAMKRSSSFSGVSRSSSASRFTRPEYGYGSGYMARSLSRGTHQSDFGDSLNGFCVAIAVSIGVFGLYYMVFML